MFKFLDVCVESGGYLASHLGIKEGKIGIYKRCEEFELDAEMRHVMYLCDRFSPKAVTKDMDTKVRIPLTTNNPSSLKAAGLRSEMAKGPDISVEDWIIVTTEPIADGIMMET